MGATSRNKGQAGEREAAMLLSGLFGTEIRRKVRQHGGDADLEGLSGWAVEIKRHKAASRADIAGWWDQAVAQARRAGALPVLLYRRDRDQWRAVWPVLPSGAGSGSTLGYDMTVEGTPEAFAAVVAGLAGGA